MWFLIACTCAMPAIQVFPSPVDRAPLNARIHLIVPTDPAGRTFELSKPEKKKSKRVEVDRSDARSGAVWFVELTPREPLEADTRYEITLGGALLGAIHTAQTPDQVPPAWAGVTKGALQKANASPGSCATGKPHAVLQHQAVPDAVLYAVWIAEGAAPIDYTKPPRAWVRDWAGKLVLGPASICTPSNADLPRSGKLRVGLKAIDHAGNTSPPSEITLGGAR